MLYEKTELHLAMLDYTYKRRAVFVDCLFSKFWFEFKEVAKYMEMSKDYSAFELLKMFNTEIIKNVKRYFVHFNNDSDGKNKELYFMVANPYPNVFELKIQHSSQITDLRLSANQMQLHELLIDYIYENRAIAEIHSDGIWRRIQNDPKYSAYCNLNLIPSELRKLFNGVILRNIHLYPCIETKNKMNYFKYAYNEFIAQRDNGPDYVMQAIEVNVKTK